MCFTCVCDTWDRPRSSGHARYRQKTPSRRSTWDTGGYAGSGETSSPLGSLRLVRRHRIRRIRRDELRALGSVRLVRRLRIRRRRNNKKNPTQRMWGNTRIYRQKLPSGTPWDSPRSSGHAKYRQKLPSRDPLDSPRSSGHAKYRQKGLPGTRLCHPPRPAARPYRRVQKTRIYRQKLPSGIPWDSPLG